MAVKPHSALGPAATVLALLLLAACDKQFQQQSFEVVDDKGTVLYTQTPTTIPSDFPVPVYPGARANTSAHAITQAAQQGAQVVMLHCDAPVEKVGQFYLGELNAQGWKMLVATYNNNTFSFQASRGGRTLSLVIRPGEADRGTDITAIVGQGD